MGIYARHVLPRLTDWVMASPAVARERGGLVAGASGRVLEIGIGTALNLPFYGPAVRILCGVDPSLALWTRGRHRAAGAPFPVVFVQGSAECLPFSTGGFDSVVSTWTLCSIPDPRAALAEIRRVLAPGGRFLFVEHGRSPDAAIRAWQARITPLWRRLAGGCHLDRPIDALIDGAGLRAGPLERGYAEGARPFSYRYRGTATAP
jgi:ubiquinone/menaquinone biosynthesis C-methylase UbiE